MTSGTAAPPTLRPEDFLAIDRMLSDEERDIRDTVRSFVRDKVTPTSATGSRRARSHWSWPRNSAR